MKRELMRQTFCFGGVGAIGFFTDAAGFWFLLSLGVNPFVARAMAFPVAVLVTWWLNRNWTFSTANRAQPRRQLNRYALVQLMGGGVNFAVYSIWLGVLGTEGWAMLAAFVVGSGVAMVVNFRASRHFAFV